jgi:hypothetical protein
MKWLKITEKEVKVGATSYHRDEVVCEDDELADWFVSNRFAVEVKPPKKVAAQPTTAPRGAAELLVEDSTAAASGGFPE